MSDQAPASLGTAKPDPSDRAPPKKTPISVLIICIVNTTFFTRAAIPRQTVPTIVIAVATTRRMQLKSLNCNLRVAPFELFQMTTPPYREVVVPFGARIFEIGTAVILSARRAGQPGSR